MTADKTTTSYNVKVPKDSSDEQLNEIVSKLKGKMCTLPNVMSDVKPDGKPDPKTVAKPVPKPGSIIHQPGGDGDIQAKQKAADVAAAQER